ncbi:hypothetical protein PG993_013415 [Apiospora rasikravindrae]|uniref:Uncharacterized protein n=1 Tax=Apiospora rasikravindrae TaxID=990691 RepID=A0ABR1RXR5_9PEZI
MKATFFIAPLVAAVATAAPTAAGPAFDGSQMLQYCDGDNLQGNCVNIYDHDLYNCLSTHHHGTRSIKVFEGYGCHLYDQTCSWSGDKVFYAGTYAPEGAWANSGAISCFQA